MSEKFEFEAALKELEVFLEVGVGRYLALFLSLAILALKFFQLCPVR